MDVVNDDKKMCIITTHQYVRSKTSLYTVGLRRRRKILKRNIKICPCRLFIINLKQFISESIESGLEVMLKVDSNDHEVKRKLAR